MLMLLQSKFNMRYRMFIAVSLILLQQVCQDFVLLSCDEFEFEDLCCSSLLVNLMSCIMLQQYSNKLDFHQILVLQELLYSWELPRFSIVCQGFVIKKDQYNTMALYVFLCIMCSSTIQILSDRTYWI